MVLDNGGSKFYHGTKGCFEIANDDILKVCDLHATDKRCLEAYERLAVAIIVSGAKAKDKRFFESSWFNMLFRKDDIDGKAMYERVCKNFEKYGSAFVPEGFAKEFKGGLYYDI